MDKSMKKNLLITFLFAALLILVTCSGRNNDTDTRPVLEIRENMFITQINYINLNSRRYLGTAIRLEGIFRHSHREGQDTFRVIRLGPGCCTDEEEFGFMVSWDPDFPESNIFKKGIPFPNTNDWVEVVGELSSFERFGFMFFYIALRELNILDRRGAEFVSR